MPSHSEKAVSFRRFLESHRRASRVVLLLIVIAGMAVASELLLAHFLGLGNPVLYDSNPLYGFRPRPHQTLKRFRGSTISLNNLGLRTDENWDDRPDDKILFLGDSVTYGGSYIDNRELFSTLAVKNLSGFKGGNAGVNSWGVENIYGLIVAHEFLPAKTYVTVLVENDFYRGVTRLAGGSAWCVKPYSAWHELLFYYVYTLNNTRYTNWMTYASERQVTRVVEIAAGKLADMDGMLRKRGMRHLIYISPTAAQARGLRQRDERVFKALQKHGLSPVYILDRLRSDGISVTGLYYDKVHLDRLGHQVWGRLIAVDLARQITAGSPGQRGGGGSS